MISVCHVSRIYRVGEVDVHALDDVCLDIARGEFVAIMGSSGSGKSTLMNLLGCLDPPSSGKYLFEGVDIGQLGEPALARIRSARVGFVFQTFNLLPRTSAIENVALPLFYSKSSTLTRPQRLALADAALRRVGLAERTASSPGQLSGGQQQRVAIARALINRPSVLLADEPTGNLDTRTSHEIMQTLRALNRTQDVTIVVVTHENDIADFMDRVITMRDGRIVSDRRKAPLSVAADEPERDPPSAPAMTHDAADLSLPFIAMILGSAAQTIRRNRMRSVLTMLGVFIGVAALIAMVAVGQGANRAVRKQIESLGTNLLVIVPGAITAGGLRAGYGSASTLTVADAQSIRRDASAVGTVSYLIRQGGQVQYADRNWTTGILGVDPAYFDIVNWHIAKGRLLTAQDQADSAMVVLIGETVYRQLFGSHENPVGAVIQVKGAPLRVVGLLAAKGQTPYGQDQDDVLILPYRTAERKVLGVAAPSTTHGPANATFPMPANPYGIAPRLTGYVNQIYVQAAAADLVPTALRQITEILARHHDIQPGAANDFAVRNLSQIAQTSEASNRIMALLLAIIASISLLVGGIGIMNILLVSVTERTREIGLRMAVGARRVHVLLQFLAEAVFLSLIGGSAGILFGVAVSEAASALSGWPTVLSPLAIAGGFVFSAAVGVFFGYYPAHKAARLNPIETLRYE